MGTIRLRHSGLYGESIRNNMLGESFSKIFIGEKQIYPDYYDIANPTYTTDFTTYNTTTSNYMQPGWNRKLFPVYAANGSVVYTTNGSLLFTASAAAGNRGNTTFLPHPEANVLDFNFHIRFNSITSTPLTAHLLGFADNNGNEIFNIYFVGSRYFSGGHLTGDLSFHLQNLDTNIGNGALVPQYPNTGFGSFQYASTTYSGVVALNATTSTGYNLNVSSYSNYITYSTQIYQISGRLNFGTQMIESFVIRKYPNIAESYYSGTNIPFIGPATNISMVSVNGNRANNTGTNGTAITYSTEFLYVYMNKIS